LSGLRKERAKWLCLKAGNIFGVRERLDDASLGPEQASITENGDMENPLIRTIGHSTRPVDALIEMLEAHGIKRLIDVRTIPKSRHNPQYNREGLERSLRDAGIGYEHMRTLGGLRHPRKDSPNTGWRNESFRGYHERV